MDDLSCFQYLAVLVFESNRHAILQYHRGLDEAKTMATQLFVDNKIFQRHDDLADAMQLQYAQILYNQGSLDEAARIRQLVLDATRQRTELEHSWELVEALRFYAESLMVSRDTAEPRALLKEALDICKTSLEPGNMHTLDCKRALAKLHKIEGRTEKAIEICYEVLKIEEEFSGDTYPNTIGTMSDLAVYLALASRWEESWEMNGRAVGLAKENLSDHDVVRLSVALNASFLIEAMCLSAAERHRRVVVVTERGGRVFATLRGERTVEEPQSTLARRSHNRDRNSRRHSLWKIMSAPARYLCSRIPYMKSEPRD
jgi:tetratricopeptide (TPR) repeat protein